MTQETQEALENGIVLGFTDKRGTAWWDHRGGVRADGTPNHFPGAVPQSVVEDLLSYPLAKVDLGATVIGADGVTTIEVPRHKAIVRTDTNVVLGVVGTGYQIHEPKEWCLNAIQMILDGGAEIAAALVLKGGAMSAVQAELPDTRETAGVKHRPFLLAATAHDGSMSTRYVRGSTVVVCDNTLAAALREPTGPKSDATQHRVTHSSRSLTRLGEVRVNLGFQIEQAGDDFDQHIQELTDQYVSDRQWAEFLKGWTGVDEAAEGRSKTMAENKVTGLELLWKDDERVAPWKNTAWGVVAAVNTYATHIQSVGSSDRAEKNALRTIGEEWGKQEAGVLKTLEIAGRR